MSVDQEEEHQGRDDMPVDQEEDHQGHALLEAMQKSIRFLSDIENWEQLTKRRAELELAIADLQRMLNVVDVAVQNRIKEGSSIRSAAFIRSCTATLVAEDSSIRSITAADVSVIDRIEEPSATVHGARTKSNKQSVNIAVAPVDLHLAKILALDPSETNKPTEKVDPQVVQGGVEHVMCFNLKV